MVTPQKTERPHGTRSRLVATLSGAVLGTVGGAIVVHELLTDWTRVRAALGGADVRWLLPAFVLASVALTSIGLNWHQALRLMGVSATRTRAVAWYFVGQLGKYVPGGIWPVVGRGELAARGGAPRTRTYAAAMLSMGATYLGALVLVSGLLTIRAIRDGALIEWLWLAGLIPFGFAAVHPAVAGRFLDTVARKTGQEPVPPPTWTRSSLLVIAHVPSWLAIAGATWCVAVSLDPAARFPEILTATVLSWVVGFLAIPVPGGLGVREAVFTVAAGSLGGGVSAAVAVVARGLFMLVDAAGASVAALGLLGDETVPPVSGRSPPSPGAPPPVPPEDS